MSMKQSYDKFCAKISTSTIDGVSKKMTKMGFEPIKAEGFNIEQNFKKQKLKSSPWLKNKQPFDNRQNLYLRIIDLMKSFIRFEEKDFLAYANKQSNFAHILNKIQMYRSHSPEFQILFYLLTTNNRKQIGTYLKLRQEILNRCALNVTKYNKISIHNQNKNFINQNIELGPVKIDYTYWGMLAELAKSQVSQDMIWWLSQGNRKVNAVDFVKACLWSHQYQTDNPEQS